MVILNCPYWWMWVLMVICLYCVSDRQPVQGVPCRLPYGSWDRPQPPCEIRYAERNGCRYKQVYWTMCPIMFLMYTVIRDVVKLSLCCNKSVLSSVSVSEWVFLGVATFSLWRSCNVYVIHSPPSAVYQPWAPSQPSTKLVPRLVLCSLPSFNVIYHRTSDSSSSDCLPAQLSFHHLPATFWVVLLTKLFSRSVHLSAILTALFVCSDYIFSANNPVCNFVLPTKYCSLPIFSLQKYIS